MTGFFGGPASMSEPESAVTVAGGWRRLAGAFLGMAAFIGAVLVGCGGTTTIQSQLKPGRIIVFGDALSDVGQVGGKRFTVNDGTATNWTERIAASYLLTVTSVVNGGLSYASGNARIVQKPDAVGNATTLTVKEQIDRFLATDRFRDTDLIIMSAGVADMLANYAASGATQATVVASTQAARDYADQIKRIVGLGAKSVLATGAYNLGLTPWGQSTGQAAFLADMSRLYDERLLVDIVGLGANVLYIDGQLYFTPVFNFPSAYGLSNSTTPACASIDPLNGNGTGVGQINARLCNTATLAITTITSVVTSQTVTFTVTGSVTSSTTSSITASSTITATALYNTHVFADNVYFTPAVQALFGDYAFGRLINRF